MVDFKTVTYQSTNSTQNSQGEGSSVATLSTSLLVVPGSFQGNSKLAQQKSRELFNTQLFWNSTNTSNLVNM